MNTKEPTKGKIAVIIGAGPAGLTAAYELVCKTDVKPIIFEMDNIVGGIARTVNYKGNRIDIGGHRFFSKSEKVMRWWLNILPLQKMEGEDAFEITYQGKKQKVEAGLGPNPDDEDRVMLVRSRLSRIFFLRKFFNYPISLTPETLRNLGLWRTLKIGASYIWAMIFPIRPEKTLEDFFINRFGRELYNTFFKDYTEKVWGLPCSEIPADWGAQRVKGLSIIKALRHAIGKVFGKDKSIGQKGTETSLIERFLYPKLGPGQMWEEVAAAVRSRGGELHLQHEVSGAVVIDGKISSVKVRDLTTGAEREFACDYVFSTMPVKHLVRALGSKVPSEVRDVAEGLMYRDFITVGLLLKRLMVSEKDNMIHDNWIYIQERDVKVGRLQIFNNWSPYMVHDPSTAWIGLEYFVNEGDELWVMDDDKLGKFAAAELEKIGIIDSRDVLDHVVIRMPKAYPAYFGTYNRFDTIRSFTDSIPNLFLIGRNGMHRYNNQDHSMLTAMAAVQNIIEGGIDKSNIWGVNTEQDYHEEKS